MKFDSALLISGAILMGIPDSNFPILGIVLLCSGIISHCYPTLKRFFQAKMASQEVSAEKADTELNDNSESK